MSGTVSALFVICVVSLLAEYALRHRQLSDDSDFDSRWILCIVIRDTARVTPNSTIWTHGSTGQYHDYLYSGYRVVVIYFRRLYSAIPLKHVCPWCGKPQGNIAMNLNLFF